MTMSPQQRARYLGLLGLERREPSYAALAEIVHAHVVRIPFENIPKLHYRKHLELRGIPVLDLFLDGIERYRFGGTCYACNFHLYELLDSLGYDAKLCGADMSKPDVHMVTLVTLEGREYLVEYCFLCAFFPKTLAGPIVRYGGITPQLSEGMRAVSLGLLAEGMTRFTIGLFKKVVLADTLARYANPIFTADAFGRDLGMVEAWGGILAYTFQLYFDFSGYTDMALGIARMFGISLPENFNSPYKATNINDFWKRWHMTLSRFLRDYLYIPLRWKQAGARAPIPEPPDHHGVMRTLAWSELDIRDLGGFAWRVSSDQPWLAQA